MSGVCVISLGRRIDGIDLRIYSTLVCLGLVAATLAMSWASSLLMLGVALFGLRLFGQGLMSHTTMILSLTDRSSGEERTFPVSYKWGPGGEVLTPDALKSQSQHRSLQSLAHYTIGAKPNPLILRFRTSRISPNRSSTCSNSLPVASWSTLTVRMWTWSAGSASSLMATSNASVRRRPSTSCRP